MNKLDDCSFQDNQNRSLMGNYNSFHMGNSFGQNKESNFIMKKSMMKYSSSLLMLITDI